MTIFVTHQFYPSPSGESPLEGPVRRRHVIYIQGFFPKGAPYYHNILGAELKYFATRYGVECALSPLRRLNEFVSRCEIEVSRDQQAVATTYDYLEWDDLIQENQRKGFVQTVISGIKTFFVHIADGAAVFMARTFWKYFIAWLLPYLLFASMGFFILSTLAAVMKFLGGTDKIWHAVEILFFSVALWGLRMFSRVTWSALMLRNFNAATAFAKGCFSKLEKRLENFEAHISEICLASQADEILIVGHSFGTQLAVLAAASASRSGAFKGTHQRVRLLTLGDSTCHMGSLKGRGAARMRQAVLYLAMQEELPWLLLYSGKDVLSFNTTDPPSALSALDGLERRVEDFKWPLMLDARFCDMLERRDYEKQRWRFFHMHSQFIFAARSKNARYDYLRAVCGAQSLPLDAKRISQKRS